MAEGFERETVADSESEQWYRTVVRHDLAQRFAVSLVGRIPVYGVDELRTRAYEYADAMLDAKWKLLKEEKDEA